MENNKDAAFLHHLNKITFKPIFILGVHRSGTSILYIMLSTTGFFNTVTAYHVINYDELLLNDHLGEEQKAKQRLTDLLQKKGVQDRGIDQLKITADFAEEYGFLLNRQTTQMCITKKNVSLFKELCKKIQFIARNNKPILLKNPYDFSNFLFIKKVFPDARFIFIHRHPCKTISSTLNALQLIFHTKNPYTARLAPWYRKIFDNYLLLQLYKLCFVRIPQLGVLYITAMTKKSTSYFLGNIDKLPPEDYFSLTYEALCSDPQKTLEDILKKFCFEMNDCCELAAMIKPRNVEVHPQVQRLCRSICRSMKQYCETFHYTSSENGKYVKV